MANTFKSAATGSTTTLQPAYTCPAATTGVVDVPADSTIVIEKPINLGAGDKLETKASANGDIDVFASILEIT